LYFYTAAAVLITVIIVRPAWHMSLNAVVRWHHRRIGFHPPRPMLRPTIGSGLVISWAGMRGIVTLAAAMALPSGFPFRNLVIFTAFAVVLGTLVIQGLTLKHLLRLLKLRDDDPVGKEIHVARERSLRAGLASIEHEYGKEADAIRQRFQMHLKMEQADDEESCRNAKYLSLYRRTLNEARREILGMRATNEIGDDAFHRIENELDWFEMANRINESE
jgi:CPA1 family monovalent cation:H+ antiporter